MSNTSELESINSVCTTAEELIKSEDWLKKAQWDVWKIAKRIDLTLDKYRWMKKKKFELNWEEKEVYMDEANLRVDSSNWHEIEIGWIKAKSNINLDIIEYLEWEVMWEQLFTFNAAMREAKNMWKRLLFVDEFQSIIEKEWVEKFNKLLPGYYYLREACFKHTGSSLSFWATSSDGDYAYQIDICDGLVSVNSCMFNFLYHRLSARCVMDIE